MTNTILFALFPASRDIAVGEELLIKFIAPNPDNNSNTGKVKDSDDDDDVMRRYVPSQPGQFGSYCLS